ncbi:MAG: prolyl oligopeptidase family serine peptidase [Limisphaerales bacterium]
MKTSLRLAALFAFTITALADGPADNKFDTVRRVPPEGIPIAPAARTELQAGADALAKDIEALRTLLKAKPALLDLLPDVQIYHKAVDWALRHDEFYTTNEVATARDLLKRGGERAAALREGKAPWLAQTGLVVRAYQSKIDGSIQPYGLVVPPNFAPGGAPLRLDFWAHGRGEKLTEMSFLDQRHKSPGQFVPPGALVLHLYGRYCNANKLAGEVDLFEALAHAKKYYPVDERRLVVRGFSMGGAAAWQFAAHYPGVWAAAAPGAGFSETPDFLKVFQKEELKPTWFERKLWHMYDCTDYAVNLFNLPTVAYSGEADSQKQAADIMAKALAAENMSLTHIIGPDKTPHRYHPDSIVEINRRIDAIVALGKDPSPDTVRFTTWTLRYNQSHWVRLDGMEEHWSRARVDATQILAENMVRVKTANVSAFSLQFPAGSCKLLQGSAPRVLVDNQKLDAPMVETDRSWTAHFRKLAGKWSLAAFVDDTSLRKRPGLQGPIDDAFLDSFLMVRPTGQPLNARVGKWADTEMKHAVEHWRRQFRGDARMKDDIAITDADIAAHNLVLWGDPASNKLLARILDRLPLRWDAQTVRAGAQSFPASEHVPVMIYPNPLNPKKYVVLNSGFTFREYDYLNNARQVPKLPDYAVIDLNIPVSSRFPGGIATAGFFGERWEVIPGGTK